MKKLSVIILAIFSTLLFAAAGDRFLINTNQDKDLILQVNDGGVQTNALKINGATGNVEMILNTASCGIGNLCSGTYAITHTAGTNVAAAGDGVGYYIRVGNIVYIGGRVQVDLTATGDFISYLSLPIASNFTVADDANGGYWAQQSAASGWILADVANDRLQLNGTLGTASNSNITFSAIYTIK